MNSRFMMSVAAAALIAGSGFAFAQGRAPAVRVRRRRRCRGRKSSGCSAERAGSCGTWFAFGGADEP